MKIPDFALERYFARHEFTAPYLLCSSDVEPWKLSELLAAADDDSRRRWESLTLGYTEAPGLPALRDEIAQLYPGLTAGDVLTFAGAEEAIFVLMNAVLAPGDHVVVTWPGYQSLYEIARAIGAEVSLWELREADHWQPEVDALGRLLRPNTKLVVVNFPHNPTGALPDPRTWRAIVERVAAHGAQLLSDEVYRGLEHRGAETLEPAASMAATAISLGVMSKSFALAGLRIGWMASRDAELLDRCGRFKDYTTICSAAPSEVLALAALRAKEAVLERSRRIVADNLAAAEAFMARHSDRIEWVSPRGGTVAFPRVLTGETASAFCERIREACGVLLLPGELYGHPGAHFRLGLGRRSFQEGLGRLERVLRQ